MFEWVFKLSSPVARRRTVKIVSPKAPSGVAWLINALINLGIRVSRVSSPSPGTFVRDNDGFYRLNEAETNLKLHFPVLAELEKFTFREDVIVEWSHDWVANDDPSDDIFMFVRDPRDALFSLYKRRNAEVGFNEFIRSLDFVTLLNQVDSWRLFIESWMSLGGITALRFEDFKQHPELNLSSFLSKIGIEQTDLESIRRAIDSSRVENAKMVEEKYKQQIGTYFTSGSPLNRKGMSFEWKSQFREYEREYKFITNRCVKQLTAFGYDLLPEAETHQALSFSAMGLVFNQPMPENLMSAWISDMCTDQKVSILRFYEDFLGSDEGKYGFYQSWEREVFEKNMIQFIRLVIPEDYSINRMLTPLALTSLAKDTLILLNSPTGKEACANSK